jgi:HSP20 family protein
MADNAVKLPVRNETGRVFASPFGAFGRMRHEIDRMFEDFGDGVWGVPRRTAFEIAPIWRRDIAWEKVPAVDVVEKEKAYEISVELPGMDEKDIQVTVANGVLTIKGEKKEEKEEKQKDYYVSERHYGSFARSFRIPEDADAGKIEARFQKGVLAVSLPKTAAAQKPEQKITVKTA